MDGWSDVFLENSKAKNCFYLRLNQPLLQVLKHTILIGLHESQEF